MNEVAVVYEKGKSAVATDMITPLSVQQLTTEEIKNILSDLKKFGMII